MSLLKILYNPENGAPIADIYKDSVLYFDSENGQTFKPGDIVKLESEVADFIVSLYEFVEEITKDEAIKMIESKKNEKFKCEECGVKFGIEKPYKEHLETHKKEARLDDELGIPVILGDKKEAELAEADNQRSIDSELSRNEIFGEGLVDVTPSIKAKFN